LQEKTGEEIKPTAIRMRYVRHQNAVNGMNEEHKQLLIAVKNRVEERLEKSKWSLMADELQEETGTKYPVCIMRLSYLRLYTLANDDYN
jgi:hypothetical protein